MFLDPQLNYRVKSQKAQVQFAVNALTQLEAVVQFTLELLPIFTSLISKHFCVMMSFIKAFKRKIFEHSYLNNHTNMARPFTGINIETDPTKYTKANQILSVTSDCSEGKPELF